MAIKKEDIKEGYYWARNKRYAPISIVRVEALFDNEWVSFIGWDNLGPKDLALAIDEFDFIARIEPPEGA